MGESRIAATHISSSISASLVGIILGTSLYALVAHFGLDGAWLALFVAPYALMQLGLVSFMRGIWAIAPQTLTLPRW